MLDDLMPPAHVGFAPTFALLLGVLGVGWGAYIVSMLVRARRLERLQAHENAFMKERASWQLLPGPSRVVHGRVEVDGEPVAIEVDVQQTVENHTNKNSRWHVWKESWRNVVARPFRLVRDDGHNVLVRPGDDVLVVDALETRYPDDQPMKRVRAATVRAGEEVYVYGDLVGGDGGSAYRGGSSLVLERPRQGRMLVATEAMQDRYRGRIRFSWRAGLGMALVFCGLHGAFTAPFVAATLFGKREEATVTSTRTYVTQGKHGPIHHWEITARDADGFTMSAEVGQDAYLQASRGAPTITILRVGDGTWASYLGDEPNVHFAVLLFGGVVALIAVILATARYESSFAWYDRKRVVEHGGAGHWIETRMLSGAGTPIDPKRN